eukprot:CAMPEP_0113957092 /NCGR_PEP_ID=MMETSP0011_2-20120614/2525_1 /TAXON_ID=101924 /ORGANISM="Rhodosorus marinus" /LENGTH=84 /DNA_ID=CAMNT_0000967511 /DNA_START=251 /DNA_END=503 /DNA_ORIENTATION=+ /assembly_acc=CAM_ASM_000156
MTDDAGDDNLPHGDDEEAAKTYDVTKVYDAPMTKTIGPTYDATLTYDRFAVMEDDRMKDDAPVTYEGVGFGSASLSGEPVHGRL